LSRLSFLKPAPRLHVSVQTLIALSYAITAEIPCKKHHLSFYRYQYLSFCILRMGLSTAEEEFVRTRSQFIERKLKKQSRQRRFDRKITLWLRLSCQFASLHQTGSAGRHQLQSVPHSKQESMLNTNKAQMLNSRGPCGSLHV
jgi:hypothetical protein